VLAVEANVDCVIADGVYHSIAQSQTWSTCDVLPVIPPPANAVVHNQPARAGRVAEYSFIFAVISFFDS
jgi:hypothetical protein